MAPEDKSKSQLLAELEKTQQRLSELASMEQKCQIVEMELRHQNKFFHHVLESLTHPFYVLDANDYTIVMANSAARLGNLSTKPTCYGLTHRRADTVRWYRAYLPSPGGEADQATGHRRAYSLRQRWEPQRYGSARLSHF